MSKKAGTTAQWERPWCAQFELPTKYIQQVDVREVLVATGMAQSKAEAYRILQQGRVWDCDVVEMGADDKPICVVTKLPPKEKYTHTLPGCKWVIGNAMAVSTYRGDVFDPTKNSIIEFVLVPKK